jgi:O-antigen ligase
MNNLKKNFNFEELYIICFPIAVLLRSTFLNFYIIVGAILFLYRVSRGPKNLINKILFYPLIIFVLYLIINSFFAENFYTAIKSSFSQIRFILFAFFISTINLKNINFKKIIITFSLITNFISLDALYQYYYGYDFFGIEADFKNNPFRLSGPFGNELIVGAFISIMSIPIVSFVFSKFKIISNKEKVYFFLTIILSFFMVTLSGERISLLIFICSTLFLTILNMGFKKFITFLTIFFIALILAYKNIQSVNYKFKEFISLIQQANKSPHIRLFSSAIIVGSNNPFIGSGLKNYREDCDLLKKINFFDPYTKEEILCSSHPHNIYLEIFAESGLIGLSIFFYIIFKNINHFIKNRKKIDSEVKFIFYSSCIVLLAYLWPIKSSGSFFSTFSASFFWFSYGLILMTTKNKNKI